MQKGLFNALFILIMIVLLSPTTLLFNKNKIIVDTTQHLNEVSLTVDSIIADALSDETYSNNCSVSTVTHYRNTILNYISNFENIRSKYTSITCEYTNLQSSFDGLQYVGTVDISCSSRNNITSLNIKKRLNFRKEINANRGVNWCKIRIKDMYSTPPYIEVDLNQSI